MRENKTISVLGYGAFGGLITKHLSRDFQVVIGSRRHLKNLPKNCTATSYQEAAKQPIIILAIPLKAYPEVLDTITQNSPPNSVVIDTCSVKLAALKLMRQHLRKDIEIVATHPLFGPESANETLQGQTCVVCSKNDASTKVSSYLKDKEVGVVYMDPKQHDKEMAKVHALTFYLAHGLMQMGLNHTNLQTPSFRKLLALAELESHHSKELFDTIQAGNPYAKKIRLQLLDKLEKLEDDIEKTALP